MIRYCLIGLFLIFLGLPIVGQSKHRPRESKDEQQDTHMEHTDGDVVALQNRINQMEKQIGGDEMLVKGVSIAISSLYAFGFLKKKAEHQ